MHPALRFASLCSFLICSPICIGYYEFELPTPKLTNSLYDWFSCGEFQLNFRPRYEFVHNTAYAEFHDMPKYNAHANTLATTLDYHTGQWQGIYGILEFNNVSSYFNSLYDSGDEISPNRIQYALIPDPKATAVTQAFLVCERFPSTLLRGGRQVIRLDNERFVGPSDFRQMPQTFDSGIFYNNALFNVELFYAFIGQVNTIWQGNDLALYGQRKNTTHLINVSSDIVPLGKFITYAYFIRDRDVDLFSNQTFGMRYLNDLDCSFARFYTQLEYADQHNLSNNPVDYHAHYGHFVLGAEISIIDIQFGYELLSGNDKTPGKAFQTPLASQHIFNGLADQFVIIPQDGLEDLYLQCHIRFWNATLYGQYHYFRAQANSDKYAEEWDVGFGFSFLKHYCLNIEYADFIGNAATHYSDVNKVWVSLNASF